MAWIVLVNVSCRIERSEVIGSTDYSGKPRHHYHAVQEGKRQPSEERHAEDTDKQHSVAFVCLIIELPPTRVVMIDSNLTSDRPFIVMKSAYHNQSIRMLNK